jgi:hypothetical protein
MHPSRWRLQSFGEPCFPRGHDLQQHIAKFKGERQFSRAFLIVTISVPQEKDLQVTAAPKIEVEKVTGSPSPSHSAVSPRWKCPSWAISHSSFLGAVSG